ncbi:hypothetical protein ACHAWC_008221 [Mediolabrus comicus]
MKVETPQILWHQVINPTQKKEAGKNSPILSCSLLDCTDGTGVLATAGNTEVNLWRVHFIDNSVRVGRNNILVKPQLSSGGTSGVTTTAALDDDDVDMSSEGAPSPYSEHTRVEHIITLTRGTNERNINAVKFSPDGHHLAAAGDGGTVVVWSTTTTKNNKQSWKLLQAETDLQMKIIFNQSDDVMDIAWSSDSKRFTVCSLDHTLTVWEKNYVNKNNNEVEWRNVHRSGKDHTHYIQGVAVDPKGVYMASQGSDRMVKVYTRKAVKENVIKGELNKYEVVHPPSSSSSSDSAAAISNQDGVTSPPEAAASTNDATSNNAAEKKAIRENKVLPDLLTNSTFALSSRTKTIKFLNAAAPSESSKSETTNDGGGDTNNDNNNIINTNTPNPKRHHMFVDELTAGSFFRRLAFTPDGAFLIVPAALWHGLDTASKTNATTSTSPPGSPTSVMANDKLAESSFATYLFARHHFEQPYKVLAGLEKPSVVIRPNPVLFQLPAQQQSKKTKAVLPYRSIFAVLTQDTVLIYDTHHNVPIAMARGLHYAGLTDASWSIDGMTLFVTSSDGYISILSFGEGELGEVYHAPVVNIAERSNVSETVVQQQPATAATQVSGQKEASVVEAAKKNVGSTEKKVHFSSEVSIQEVPPSDGPIINTLAPRKKMKKAAPIVEKETITEEMKGMVIDKDSSIATAPVVNILQPKKKKKIAPTLVSGPN